MRILSATIALSLFLANAALAQIQVGFGGTEHNSSDPIEITSDSLAVNQEDGTATFIGNVIAVQGDLRMAAAEILVVYNVDDQGNTQDVRDVIGSGSVLITRGTEAAEGDRAVYEVAEDLLTMTGEVLVTQGTGAVSGERLVVNMLTGVGAVDGGRVRTVLQPQDASE